MNETEYLRLSRQIESEYKRNLEALDRIWGLSNQGVKPPDSSSVQLRESAERTPRGEITAIVRRALKQVNGQFTWKGIREAIAAESGMQPNRTTITQALRRLREQGRIVEVEQGRGKLAAVYLVAKKEAEPQAMASAQLVAQIRELAVKSGYSTERFRSEFMQGYTKLAEMPSLMAERVLAELQVLMDDPSEVESESP
jgi:DNA-binding transcriptional regulator YhcF (GntR family)